MQDNRAHVKHTSKQPQLAVFFPPSDASLPYHLAVVEGYESRLCGSGFWDRDLGLQGVGIETWAWGSRSERVFGEVLRASE